MLHVSSIPAFARLRQHVVRAALATVLWPAAAIAEPTVAARWNQSLLDAVKATRSSDVVTARSLAVVHTAMFDAWASYDDKALSTTTGAASRRPAGERTAANKEKAVSYAAYRTLIDLFPSEKEKLTQALRGMGHDPNDAALDPATPVGI